MEVRKENLRVVMFPWLAHGHISSFLELAKALAKRNFTTYLFTTHANLAFFKQTLSREEFRRIKLMEIMLPYLPQLPSHFHTTNGLPPHLLNTLKKAFLKGKPDFYTILDTFRPDLIIYDFLLPCVPLMASTLNFPAVMFLTNGAENDGIDEKNGTTRCFERSKEIILIHTFRELEGKYIDYLSYLFNKKFLAVGPLVRAFDQTDGGQRYVDKIIEWLNEREKCSTIFVSFGSECYLSKQEIEELALGLELSMLNFIWVIRFPIGDKMDIPDVLTEGFVERTWDRGVILEHWAPQGRILEHSSIGGFVSHCGWNSVMEALKCGVPIIAMPMQKEQPLSTRLLVNEVGVGLEIQRDEEGNIHKEEVAKTVREVVLEKSGENVRNKAKEFREIMREDGENDMDGVVEELIDLRWRTGPSHYIGQSF